VTNSDRDVHVSGGKGVVVGDYNTVFQIFGDSPPTIASYIRSAQFRGLVDERTKGFVGREFVFDAVDRVLAGEEFSSGYIVIRGEPGIGKTAIAASLVARRGYVHHFNIAPENIRSPRQFLENVCAQLIVRYGLDHTTLPPQAGTDGGYLAQLLVEATDRAQGRPEPVVIVVDALDEAEDTNLAPSANRLYLPRALPEGVFFVLTTREEADYRLDIDHESEIWIRDQDPANQQDVARYIEGFLDENADAMQARLSEWGLTPHAFTEKLKSLSEGNFMYLVHVLPEIARGVLLGRDAAGGVKALPRGLKGYYKRHWRDMKDADSHRFMTFQRPILCFLAISREPITVPQLVEWTRIEPGEVKDVIREWREFLNEEPDVQPATYRIYHRSFADFLDEEENLRWYHNKIAQTALAKIPDFLDA